MRSSSSSNSSLHSTFKHYQANKTRNTRQDKKEARLTTSKTTRNVCIPKKISAFETTPTRPSISSHLTSLLHPRSLHALTHPKNHPIGVAVLLLHRKGGCLVRVLGVLELLRQPVQALVQTLAIGGAGGLSEEERRERGVEEGKERNVINTKCNRSTR